MSVRQPNCHFQRQISEVSWQKNRRTALLDFVEFPSTFVLLEGVEPDTDSFHRRITLSKRYSWLGHPVHMLGP